MASSTLLALRRALAYALDDLGVHGVGSATPSTVTLPTASNATPKKKFHRDWNRLFRPALYPTEWEGLPVSLNAGGEHRNE